MKIRASFSQVKKRRQFVLGVGYCTLQRLLNVLRYQEGLYCTNRYGWACDFYGITDDIGIVTGYEYTRASTMTAYDLSPKLVEALYELEQSAYRVDAHDLDEIEDIRNRFLAVLGKAKAGGYAKKYVGYYNGAIWATGESRSAMRDDFYKSRVDLAGHYRLDHTPKYSDLEISIE